MAVKRVYSTSHAIAYNFKTAAWEDYGTKTEFGSQAATMVVGPYFVVQTGDLVRLKDINHYELGRFTDPYYIWSLNNPDSPPPPLPPPSPPPSPPTPPPIPRPYSTSSIDITADHVEGQWKSLFKTNMEGGRYVLWKSEPNEPFIPYGEETSSLYVYNLETDTQLIYAEGTPNERDYGLETKVYSTSHAIAYNFKTAAWEDYGTAFSFGYSLDSPYFVEQTGDSVVLLNMKRRVLGRFTDPYYDWTT